MLSYFRNSLRRGNPIRIIDIKHHGIIDNNNTSAIKRFMGGGPRNRPLHRRTIPPTQKHRLILRYADLLLGVKANRPFKECPPQPILHRKVRQRKKERVKEIQKYYKEEMEKGFWLRAKWISIDSFLYSNMFRGWTKEKHFIKAFEGSNGRYELKQVDRPPTHKKYQNGFKTMTVVRINRDHPRYQNHPTNNNDDDPDGLNHHWRRRGTRRRNSPRDGNRKSFEGRYNLYENSDGSFEGSPDKFRKEDDNRSQGRNQSSSFEVKKWSFSSREDQEKKQARNLDSFFGRESKHAKDENRAGDHVSFRRVRERKTREVGSFNASSRQDNNVSPRIRRVGGRRTREVDSLNADSRQDQGRSERGFEEQPLRQQQQQQQQQQPSRMSSAEGNETKAGSKPQDGGRDDGNTSGQPTQPRRHRVPCFGQRVGA